MNDDVASHRTAWLVAIVVALLVAGTLTLPLLRDAAPTRSLQGIVVSSGTVSISSLRGGGTREAVKIRLADGREIIASVSAGGPYAAGDPVQVLEKGGFPGGASYEAIGRQVVE
ncbi:MAG: hypothetical protein ABI411_14245 [Tahibacter sp.]